MYMYYMSQLLLSDAAVLITGALIYYTLIRHMFAAFVKN